MVTTNTMAHLLQERAAFPNRAAWRAHVAQQRRAARTGGRVALPAGIDLTPAESAMVAHLNRALPGPDARGELLNRLGRERTYGYAAEGEVAESARQKLAAAWRG